MTMHEHHAQHAHHGGDAFPGGLRISQDGYTLAFENTLLKPGEQQLRFQILGPDGKPVTEFTSIHDRELHLIIARRELTHFWHVHPELDADGTWSISIELPYAGAYRAFTDIQPTALGSTITLGSDLAIAGDYEPGEVPAIEPAFTVDDYEVSIAGELATGDGGHLTLTVRRSGELVSDLEPYLGAYGHLVLLRLGDLAYVHVHPHGEPGDGVTPSGPEISFHAVAPGPGTYRAFLDFQHGGVVRTAAFTLLAMG